MPKDKSLRFKIRIMIICSALIVLALVYKMVLGADFIKNIILQLGN